MESTSKKKQHQMKTTSNGIHIEWNEDIFIDFLLNEITIKWNPHQMKNNIQEKPHPMKSTLNEYTTSKEINIQEKQQTRTTTSNGINIE